MYVAIVFLPALGALIAGTFRAQLGDRGSQLVTCGAMGLSMILGIVAFIDVALGGNTRTIELFDWISSGSMQASWALKFDTLTAVMVMVVTVVSTMVHVYSIGYMSHDPHKPRFMAYLSMFTFAMLMLVTADNLVQLFFGWEGVGLASYLLIGFWYHKPTANAAAIKAFVVNRVGDFGFALGIFGVYILFDTVSFDAIFAAAASKQEASITFLWWEANAITVLSILLFIGAMGKSAQLGLHTWLPDAMEGPTPVSALIHAATMVTAGVFMVARLSPLIEYSADALTVITFVGAATAFFAATVGLCQNDIKRVIAYSTCSQLGYMFFALGVSAYSAAIFHLMTHAFFKALLFLGAGSVIHAMSDEQDMRKMGGIWRKIPLTYSLMWIGSLALAGVPFFAGYYSKDLIIEAAFASGSAVGEFAFWMGITAAVLTAFYSWRLIIMTFHGKTRASDEVFSHVHESPKVMTIPLIVLAIGAIFSGWLGYDLFAGDARADFWGPALLVLEGHDTIEGAHHVPLWVKLCPIIAGVLGIGTAYWFYMLNPSIPGKLATTFRPIYLFLLNKWYFDELYDAVFVRPAMRIGRALWKGGDGAIIDGFGPDGISAVARVLAGRAGRLQTGYVYHYAFAMLIGVIGFVSWFVLV
ncbi:MAG: NADH-quinone oxidoreductase subunit L [Rhodospirillaceae bacterium]|jgi:NADH-quinone oxidoreductase subunit L|nr:NADH-quinone oxidoreductase subunit L [Rhodospirillaceae bacterium]